MPRKTWAQLNPRTDFTLALNVSVLNPSLRHQGCREGRWHLKCIRGVERDLTSKDLIRCVVALEGMKGGLPVKAA
jgi:hypothetical protein